MRDLWQCHGCSKWMHEREDCGACGAPRPPANAIKHATFTLRSQCVHCGGPLPLLGPQRAVHCDSCQQSTPITANEWGRILWAASFGVSEANVHASALPRLFVSREVSSRTSPE